FGGQVLLALILLAIGWMAAGWMGRLTRSAIDRARIDATLGRFLSNLVQWGVVLLVVLGCLGIFGVETTSFAAVLGSAGIAIGLAFQGTLSSFAAGMMLLIFRPFKVGDAIRVAGQLGKVYEIGLFTTSLDSFDNLRIVIPNAQVFGATIENLSYHATRRFDVDVGVSYSADIDQTRELLSEATAGVDGVLEDPAAAVLLQGLGASSVDWTVRAWAKADVFFDVKQAVTRAIKVKLDAAGVEIPFPQMDVHLSRVDGTDA
ncbi:MAG: mechanosensitive ion channel, partial [Planctomycetales bacterium]|nr:mechanosensitive ion channel [Planctomycetales bacterium]